MYSMPYFFYIAPPPIPFFHYVRNMWRLKSIAMSVFLRVGKLKYFSWKALLQIRKETAYNLKQCLAYFKHSLFEEHNNS